MSSLSIRNITLPEWLRANRRLQKAVLVCAALLIADLLLYAFLVVPYINGIRSLEARYGELRKRRTEAILFEKQKKELTGIRAGIPTQKDMPILVKDLVQSARRLNLTVSAITYDIPKRSGEELAILSFAFPAEGRYADIKRFVYEIETSDRPVGIQDLKLEGDKGLVRMQLKLVTYVKGQ
ncbi:MAG TPA: type 4a pilus biogenesis protein PilO [Nitrospirota bacterium]|nr:type 4a pilus biogenesis protein PilO [Nitrospirota bacterium]